MFARTTWSDRQPLATSTLRTGGFGPTSSRSIQPKLVVGPADDPLEREADRMADAVVGSGTVGWASAGWPPAPMVQRKCGKCEEEDMVHGKDAITSGPVAPAVASSILTNAAPGRSLSSSERSFFDARFGHRFDQVRVHDGERAARLSAGVGARAFTYGQDVFLGRGQYAAGTQDGRRLMAHELAHTLQQAHEGSVRRLTER